MPLGLSVALVLLAQVSAQSSAAPPATPPAASTATRAAASPAEPDCSPNAPGADQREIVICAQRPQGYRLNPDVLEAHRETHGSGASRMRQMTPDSTCGVVGPAPCLDAGINLIGAAITAATMVEKAVKGENVGKMFITDPHPDEYHRYLAAKQRREEHEAEVAAAKAAAATKAAAAAKAADPPTSVNPASAND